MSAERWRLSHQRMADEILLVAFESTGEQATIVINDNQSPEATRSAIRVIKHLSFLVPVLALLAELLRQGWGESAPPGDRDRRPAYVTFLDQSERDPLVRVAR